jgi:hypothetical protein
MEQETLLENLPEVSSYEPRKPKPPGRAKGTKNKLTLLREAVLQKQEHVILRELPKIIAVVCQKAQEGDLTAAKLILERIIPVRKQSDEEGGPKGPPTINITVSGTTTKVEVMAPPPQPLDIDEADFEEIEETENE